MRLPTPIIQATTVKRYKRFFLDARLSSGEIVTAHCPNTGPMTSCYADNWQCILSQNSDPKRKLKYTLQLISNGQVFILANTHLPNVLIHEALVNKELPGFENYDTLNKEVTIGNSRFDFMLTAADGTKTIIEVKNVSSKDDNGAYFPDTRSERALKHVKELTRLQAKGYKCVLIFLIAREDCHTFRPAGDIMPDYLQACQDAALAGVELRAFQWKISPDDLSFKKEIPVILT